MLEKSYNGRLRYRLATTPEEVESLIGSLPATVSADLTQDLEGSDEAEKFYLASQTAYAF